MAEGTVTMYDKVSPSVVPLTGTREPVKWPVVSLKGDRNGCVDGYTGMNPARSAM